MISRREFLATTLATTATAFVLDAAPSEPWYRRVTRWGQTNITEKDPVRYAFRGGANTGSVPRYRESS
jgi:hypothetical protein